MEDNLQNPIQTDDIQTLIKELDNPDGMERRRARISLVTIGYQAVPALIKVLSDERGHVRWEAGKALGEIGDPSAAPALVKLLEDDNQDVRGVASEGLIALDRGSVVPLLQALVKRFSSVWLRNGAHHVLHILKQRGHLTDPEVKVFDALEDVVPEVEVPWAAENALEALGHLDK